MKLIVQIPAYNEEKTIAQTLRDVPKRIDGFTTVETLVIDDGSADKTVEAARKAGVTHVVELRSHRGLAAAFVAGIDAALALGADVIVNTDADNQYAGSDIPKLVAPIVNRSAEVVVGDRQVASSPHMSSFRKMLQRLGSWTVGKASGIRVADATSGFRAFSREAALQINVFNPFTYTLETIIQAGNHNLGIQTVPVRTNPPTRESRLYRGVGTYLRKSIATIFRVYALYRPLKTFFAIGSVLVISGLLLGARFLWHFLNHNGTGHVQSLILCGVLLITGFQTWLIALLADLIGVNRRLSEEVLVRVKKLEGSERPPAAARPQQQQSPQRAARPQGPPPRRDSPGAQSPPQGAAARRTPQSAPAEKSTAEATQWVWLVDKDAVSEEAAPAVAEAAPVAPVLGGASRRRRRRRGPRQSGEGAGQARIDSGEPEND